LIQRHILGLSKLDSPYKVIAADINNSESITASDLVELRKLILGLYAELPNNGSWRFVDAAQEFFDNQHPFPFNDKISVLDFLNDDMDNDFKVVKIGDVNSSVEMDNFRTKGDDNRYTKSITFSTANQTFAAGAQVIVPVTAQNFNEVTGYQFNIAYTPAMLSFDNVISGALEVTKENFGNTVNGNVATSWNNAKGLSFDNNEVLFTLVFNAKTNGTISNNLTFNSHDIAAEAYDQSLTHMNVDFNVNAVISNDGFQLLQNNPNPFSFETNISFNLPAAQSATLTFFDVTGKTLTQVSGSYAKGVNTIKVNSDMLNTQGIVYYQLSTSEFTDTKKMIMLKN
jgi:protein associated with RNAse G/E